MPPERPAERTVWEGTPSPMVNLATYVLLLVGAILATAALVFARAATPRPDVGAHDFASVVPWVILAVWGACAGVALTTYLRVRSVRYQLTTQRLRITTGILSTRTEEIELRRVRDTSVVRPFFLRLAGLGNVYVVSGDPTAPRVMLHAVRSPDVVQSRLRDCVQDMIAHFRVRELEVMDDDVR